MNKQDITAKFEEFAACLQAWSDENEEQRGFILYIADMEHQTGVRWEYGNADVLYALYAHVLANKETMLYQVVREKHSLKYWCKKIWYHITHL